MFLVLHFINVNSKINRKRSNEKRSYNTSRRIRKGCKERLNHLMLMRPLRNKTKVLSDEYELESPDEKGPGKEYIHNYRTLNRHRFVSRVY